MRTRALGAIPCSTHDRNYGPVSASRNRAEIAKVVATASKKEKLKPHSDTKRPDGAGIPLPVDRGPYGKVTS